MSLSSRNVERLDLQQRRVVDDRRLEQQFAALRYRELQHSARVSGWKDDKDDEEEPDECGLCLERPFHVRQDCPALRDLDSIDKRILFWSQADANAPNTKDNLCELRYFRAKMKQRQQEEIMSLVREASRMPKRETFAEYDARVQKENEVTLQLSEEFVARDGVFAPSLNQNVPITNSRDRLARQLAQRDPDRSIVNPPADFVALDLPETEHECRPDYRRAFHGLHKFAPWFPPPPRVPVEYADAKRRVRYDIASDGDKALVDAYERECQRWEQLLPEFMQRHAQDKSLFERRLALQPDQEVDESKAQEFVAAFLPRNVAGYDDPSADPAAPPWVRGWQPISFSIIEADQMRYPGLRYFVVSNVSHRPRFLPSPGGQQRRVDGHYGEHTAHWYPQWHIDGQWYMAFHETFLNPDGSDKSHSREDGDFLWYVLQEMHLHTTGTRVAGAEHCKALRLSKTLLASVVRDYDDIVARVRFWRTEHPWAVDFPHDVMLAASSSGRVLHEVWLGKRHLLDTVAGFQRALGILRAWCNYRFEFRNLLRRRHRANKIGKPFAPMTMPEWVGKYRGAYSDKAKVIDRLAQMNCPVYGVMRKPDPTWERLAYTTLLDIRFEGRAWADGGVAPIYISPLRPIFNPEVGAHLVKGDAEGTSVVNDPGLYDDGGGFDGGSGFGDSGLQETIGAERLNGPDASSPTSASIPKTDGSSSAEHHMSSASIPSVSSQGQLRGAKRARDGSKRRLDDVDEEQVTPKKAKRRHGRADGAPKGTTTLVEMASQRKELGAHNRGRQKTHLAVPGWVPAAYAFSTVDSDDNLLGAERQYENQIRADRPVPIWLRESTQVHRVPPPDIVLRDNQNATTEMLRRLIIITPYTDQNLLQHFTDLSDKLSLTRDDWTTVLKGAVKDWDKSTQRPIESMTLLWASKIGMREFVQGAAAVVSVARKDEPLFLDDWSDSEDDDGEGEKDEKEGADGDTNRNAIPRVNDYYSKWYFLLDNRNGIQPEEPETRRYLYQPQGWTIRDDRTERGINDFSWFVEMDPEYDTNAKGSEVYKFVLETPSKATVEDWTRHYPVFVNYEHAWVLVLRSSPEPNWRNESGERIFKCSIRLMERASSNTFRRHGADVDYANLRVWFGWDMKTPLTVPVDALEAFGSKTLRPQWNLSEETWAFVTSRWRGHQESQSFVSQSSAPTPSLQDTMSSHSTTQQQQRTLRGWIDSHLAVSGGEYWYDGHRIPAAVTNHTWPQDDIRGYVFWRTGEQYWRVSFSSLDMLIISIHTDTTSMSPAARQDLRARVWGSGSLVPHGDNPLTAPQWRVRRPCVEAMAQIVATWPGTRLPKEPADNAMDTEPAFIAFERMVWADWKQIYADFMFRDPPPLYLRPASPWSS